MRIFSVRLAILLSCQKCDATFLLALLLAGIRNFWNTNVVSICDCQVVCVFICFYIVIVCVHQKKSKKFIRWTRWNLVFRLTLNRIMFRTDTPTEASKQNHFQFTCINWSGHFCERHFKGNNIQFSTGTNTRRERGKEICISISISRL